jgi:hypothetical protein
MVMIEEAADTPPEHRLGVLNTSGLSRRWRYSGFTTAPQERF